MGSPSSIPGASTACCDVFEREGLVTSAWADGDFGPQKRDYRLTHEGCQRLIAWRPHLEARERAFRSVIEAIDSLARLPAGAPST